GDYGALASRMTQLAPRPARVVVFLEGGYDLDALRDGTAATVAALVGEAVDPGEPPTSGGPGREVVDAAADLWRGGAGLSACCPRPRARASPGRRHAPRRAP